eukprot:110078-Rhodomonas_salina.2
MIGGKRRKEEEGGRGVQDKERKTGKEEGECWGAPQKFVQLGSAQLLVLVLVESLSAEFVTS